MDVICYRRHGHNELDQPMFTQPLLYSKIGKHPSTLDLYEQRSAPPTRHSTYPTPPSDTCHPLRISAG